MKTTRIVLVIDCLEEEDCAGVTAQTVLRDHGAVLEWARDITGGYGEATLAGYDVYPALGGEK